MVDNPVLSMAGGASTDSSPKTIHLRVSEEEWKRNRSFLKDRNQLETVLGSSSVTWFDELTERAIQSKKDLKKHERTVYNSPVCSPTVSQLIKNQLKVGHSPPEFYHSSPTVVNKTLYEDVVFSTPDSQGHWCRPTLGLSPSPVPKDGSFFHRSSSIVGSLGISNDDSVLSWTNSLATPPRVEDSTIQPDTTGNAPTSHKDPVRALFSTSPHQDATRESLELLESTNEEEALGTETNDADKTWTFDDVNKAKTSHETKAAVDRKDQCETIGVLKDSALLSEKSMDAWRDKFRRKLILKSDSFGKKICSGTTSPSCVNKGQMMKKDNIVKTGILNDIEQRHYRAVDSEIKIEESDVINTNSYDKAIFKVKELKEVKSVNSECSIEDSALANTIESPCQSPVFPKQGTTNRRDSVKGSPRYKRIQARTEAVGEALSDFFDSPSQAAGRRKSLNRKRKSSELDLKDIERSWSDTESCQNTPKSIVLQSILMKDRQVRSSSGKKVRFSDSVLKYSEEKKQNNSFSKRQRKHFKSKKELVAEELKQFVTNNEKQGINPSEDCGKSENVTEECSVDNKEPDDVFSQVSPMALEAMCDAATVSCDKDKTVITCAGDNNQERDNKENVIKPDTPSKQNVILKKKFFYPSKQNLLKNHQTAIFKFKDDEKGDNKTKGIVTSIETSNIMTSSDKEVIALPGSTGDSEITKAGDRTDTASCKKSPEIKENSDIESEKTIGDQTLSKHKDFISENMKTLGFQSASGKGICLSTEAVEKARKLLDECNESLSTSSEKLNDRNKQATSHKNETKNSRQLLKDNGNVTFLDDAEDDFENDVWCEDFDMEHEKSDDVENAESGNNDLVIDKRLLHTVGGQNGEESETREGASLPTTKKYLNPNNENVKNTDRGMHSDQLGSGLKQVDPVENTDHRPVSLYSESESIAVADQPKAGFATACGRQIHCDGDMLKKAEKMFSNMDDCSVKYSRLSDPCLADKDKRQRSVLNDPSDYEQSISVNNMIGFTTASGKGFKLSKTALDKAQNLLNDDGPNKQLTSEKLSKSVTDVTGFTTAAGKDIKLSKAAMDKAESLLEENEPVTELISTEKQQISGNEHEKPGKILLHDKVKEEIANVDSEQSMSITGFTTASGKGLKLSKTALNKAQNVLNEDGPNTDLTSENHDREVSKVVTGITGFTTAAGKVVKLSKSAMKKAQNLLEEIEPDTELTMSEKQCKDFSKGVTGMTGFTTAAGKGLKLSTAAMEKAQNLLEENEPDTDLTIPEKQCKDLSKGVTGMTGFTTAAGKGLKMSNAAMEKAQSLFKENESKTEFTFNQQAHTVENRKKITLYDQFREEMGQVNEQDDLNLLNQELLKLKSKDTCDRNGNSPKNKGKELGKKDLVTNKPKGFRPFKAPKRITINKPKDTSDNTEDKLKMSVVKANVKHLPESESKKIKSLSESIGQHVDKSGGPVKEDNIANVLLESIKPIEGVKQDIYEGICSQMFAEDMELDETSLLENTTNKYDGEDSLNDHLDPINGNKAEIDNKSVTSSSHLNEINKRGNPIEILGQHLDLFNDNRTTVNKEFGTPTDSSAKEMGFMENLERHQGFLSDGDIDSLAIEGAELQGRREDSSMLNAALGKSHSLGFQTAGRKSIFISYNALEAARKTFENQDSPYENVELLNKKGVKGETLSIPAAGSVLCTVNSGKTVEDHKTTMETDSKVTAKQIITGPLPTLAKDKTFPDKSLNDSKSILKNDETESDQSLFIGFKTVGGKGIQISDSALEHAKQTLNNVEEASDYQASETLQTVHEQDLMTTAGNMKDRDTKENNHSTAVFMGFKTARGRDIDISSKALEEARKTLDSEDNLPDISEAFTAEKDSKAFNTKQSRNSMDNKRDRHLQKSERKSLQALDSSSKDAENDLKLVKNIPSKQTSIELQTTTSVLEQGDSYVSMEDNLHNRPLIIGFQTATGKDIHISSNALQKARLTLRDEENTADHLDMIGFKTAGGQNIKISNGALDKARKTLKEKEEALSNHRLMGFKTAGGNNINISSEALIEVRKSLNNTEIMSDTSSIMGFQTAGGRDIKISDRSLHQAKKTLEEKENVLVHSNEFGFKTAGGKGIKVLDKALEEARKVLSDKENVCNIQKLFQTLNEKDISYKSSKGVRKDLEIEENTCEQTFDQALNTSNIIDQDHPVNDSIKMLYKEDGYLNSVKEDANKPMIEFQDKALQDARKMLRSSENCSENTGIHGCEIPLEKEKIPSEYIVNKSMKCSNVAENSNNDTPFMGFQTAKGSHIQVSEKALLAARNNFNSDEGNFKGFQSASGKSISVSEKALRAARNSLNDGDDDLADVHNEEDTGCIQEQNNSNKTEHRLQDREELFKGFQTASGSKIAFSEKALEAARKHLNSDTEIPYKPTTLGFQTASGSKITFSDKALEAARKHLNSDTEISDKPTTLGFQTAIGSKMTFSEDALQAARKHLNSDTEISDKPKVLGFQTAGGSNINISDEALKAARKQLNPDTEISDKPKMMGFQTAGGSNINVSDQALQAARKHLDSDREVLDKPVTMGFQTASGSRITLSDDALQAARKHLNSDKDTLHEPTMLGFQTAGGSKITFSDEALKAARKQLNSYEEITDKSTMMGFQTAGGSKITFSDDALQAARKQLNSDKEMSDKQTLGFQTAGGSKITFSNEALKAARKQLNTNEEITDKPTMMEFQTAGGNKVNLSESALQKAKETLSEVNSDIHGSKIGIESEEKDKVHGIERHVQDGIQKGTWSSVCDAPPTRQFIGFQTAGGSNVQVSDKALMYARNQHLESVDKHPNGESASVDTDELCETEELKILSMLDSELSIKRQKLGCQQEKQILHKAGFSDTHPKRKPLRSAPEGITTDRRHPGFRPFKPVFSRHLGKQQKSTSSGPEKPLPTTEVKNAFQTPYKKSSSASSDYKSDAKVDLPINTKTPVFNSKMKHGLSKTSEDFIIKTVTNDSTSSNSHEHNTGKNTDEYCIRKTECKVGKILTESSSIQGESRISKDVTEKNSNHGELTDFNGKNLVNRLKTTELETFDSVSEYGFKSNAGFEISCDMSPNRLKSCKDKSGFSVEIELSTEISEHFDNGGVKKNRSDLESENGAEVDGSHDLDLVAMDIISMDTSEMSSFSQDEEDVYYCNLVEARTRQEEIIKSCQKMKIEPVTGRLYEMKEFGSRFKLADVVTKGQSMIKKNMCVTSMTAEEFKFDIQCYYGNHSAHVLLGNGAFLVPDNEGKAGKQEFYRAFLTMDGVDSKLISDVWLFNHFRWIVWKLAAYEQTHCFHGRSLTPENVMLQLKYRYDREIDRAERSCLKKIFERDDAPSKRLVLCLSKLVVNRDKVSTVANLESPKVAAELTDGCYKIPVHFDRPLTELRGTVVAELTDGWYMIPVQFDGPLTELCCQGTISVGQKLCIAGADLVGSTDACTPLEAPADLHLKININSTRPVRWDCRLGYQTDPRPLCVPLTSLHDEGGTIGVIDVVLVRKYPTMYMEKLASGGSVFRTQRDEERVQQQHQCRKQVDMEKLYAQIQREMEQEQKQESAQKIGKRKYSNAEIEQLSSGEDIHDAIETSLQPDRIQNYLSDQQRGLLFEYQRCLQEEKGHKLNMRVQAAWEEKEEETPTERSVTPMLKFRVAGCANSDLDSQKSTILTVWRPATEISDLKEGKRYKIYSLNASTSRSKYTGSIVQLTATKQTKFMQLEIDENLMDRIYEPREVLWVNDIKRRQPPFGELDFVGLIVRVVSAGSIDSIRNPDMLYLADCQGSFLCVKAWNGLKSFGEDIFTEGSCICMSNLMDKSPYRNKHLPTVEATLEFTNITRKPQNSAQRHALDKLHSIIKNKPSFKDDMVAVLDDLLYNRQQRKSPNEQIPVNDFKGSKPSMQNTSDNNVDDYKDRHISNKTADAVCENITEEIENDFESKANDMECDQEDLIKNELGDAIDSADIKHSNDSSVSKTTQRQNVLDAVHLSNISATPVRSSGNDKPSIIGSQDTTPASQSKQSQVHSRLAKLSAYATPDSLSPLPVTIPRSVSKGFKPPSFRKKLN